MPSGVFAVLAEVAATLTLDARDTAVACPALATEDVVVCAWRDTPTTRFPMRLEGTSGVLLIEPGGPRNLRCNLDFILRAKLKGRRLHRFGFVGSQDVVGSAILASVQVAGRRDTVSASWADGRSVRSADCSTGPAILRSKVTRFLLGPKRANSTEHVLPFSTFRTDRVYADVPIGRGKIAARFELDHDINLLTAPAARLAAPVLGGSTTGPAYLTMVLWGIHRRVRLFQTQRPLLLGGHALRDLYVRIEDYGQANGLRAIDPKTADSGDIVAKAKHVEDDGPPLLRVGRSGLAGCESITVDERRRKVILVC